MHGLRCCLVAILLLTAAPGFAFDLILTVTDEAGTPLADAALVLEPEGANGRPGGGEGDGSGGSEVGKAPAPATIVQRQKTFLPRVTTIGTGALVSFPNEDTVRHHVYSFSPAKTFELKLYLGTPAAPVLFDKPGLVVLGCNIHDHMVAYILVGDSPWHGVTGSDGRLVLKDVPAGAYRLRHWHPRWAGLAEPQTVPLQVGGAQPAPLVIPARPAPSR